MMKKTYINPNMSVVKLNVAAGLLAGSGVKSGDTVGQEYKDTDVTYGREFDFFDED